MAGDRYFITDQHATYFLTCTVVYWVDIFTRKEYRDIITSSLNYCIEHKGLEVNAWIIMSNHFHLVCRADEKNGISNVLRDFKKHTSKQILECIKTIPESRKDWLLNKFAFEAQRSGRAENYKLWKDDNHAIHIDQKVDVHQKIRYIHENPVRAGLVYNIDDYVYSSTLDYAGRKGLVNVTML